MFTSLFDYFSKQQLSIFNWLSPKLFLFSNQLFWAIDQSIYWQFVLIKLFLLPPDRAALSSRAYEKYKLKNLTIFEGYHFPQFGLINFSINRDKEFQLGFMPFQFCQTGNDTTCVHNGRSQTIAAIIYGNQSLQLFLMYTSIL